MAPRDGTGPRIRRAVTSCGSCLAWGLTFSQGVCLACYNFAGRNRVAGECGGCGRNERLKAGYCRLCWEQAYLDRPTGPGTPLAPYLRKVRHHQLFFADLARRRATPRAFPRRYGVKGRPRKPPPPVVARPRPGWVQPPLFDDAFPRAYGYGRIDLRRGPGPDNPWLGWALHLAHTIAEVRGFDTPVRHALNRNLVMLLASHGGGETIRVSDFQQVLTSRGSSAAHTIEILTTMGVLIDDRQPAFDRWLQAKLDRLGPAIQRDVRRWIRTLHDGGPRTRARDERTVRIYLAAVRPALADWSARYEHLREVTRDDIRRYTSILLGHDRQTAATAMRSLFRWAKQNGVVFGNPTVGLTARKPEPAVLQPLRAEQIGRTIQAATTPQARLFVALAAVHAARPGQIRALQLDDVDLGDRRLTIAGHDRPLDELTYRVLVEWLDHRRERWPNTGNQHLLVSFDTAIHFGPVSHAFVTPALRGLPATIERLRIDRQLEEALTHRADPLHLAAVFGISDTTAVRYAASARQLLQRPHETDPVDSPRTQGSICDTEPGRYFGSR
jgi:hypothetical protein